LLQIKRGLKFHHCLN